MRPLAIALAALMLGGVAASHAQGTKVWDGITAGELLAFGRKHGWQMQQGTAGRSVSIRVKGQSATLYLTGCNAAGRCAAGMLRTITFYFLRNGAAIRHWNMGHTGGTGFSSRYVTFQRFLRFRGVTDVYIREAIEDWARGSKSFWAAVRRQWLREREARRTQKPK